MEKVTTAPLGTVSGKEIWVVNAEDVDEYRIKVIGAFGTLEMVIEFMRKLMFEEDNKDDYFEFWWYERYQDDDSTEDWEDVKENKELREKYVGWLKRKIERTIEKWRESLEQTLPPPEEFRKRQKLLKKREGFEWGIFFYRFSKTELYYNY